MPPLRRGLAALALVLATAGGVAAETPRGTIVMVKRIDDMASVDPAEATAESSEEVIGNVYDRLIDRDPSGGAAFRPALAQSWSVEEGGRRYIFRLRSGVLFHSGRRVTAEDAAFSLRRVLLLGKEPAMLFRRLGLAPDARIRAVDESTLVIETERALAPSLFLECLSTAAGSVLDRGEVLTHDRRGDLGDAWLAGHAEGSGPYRLRLWHAGDRYRLEANDEYWQGPPKNRAVVVLNVADRATQRLLLERGDADYARDLDRAQLEAIRRNPAIAFDFGLQATLTYLALNQGDAELRRPEVAEALRYLIDYQAIVTKVLGGTRIVHQTIVPTGLLGASEDTPYHYDLPRARRLLAEAGLGDGVLLSLDVRGGWPWTDIAEALRAGFAPAGIRLEVRVGEVGEVLGRYRARRHQLFLGDWEADYPDPNSNAEAFAMESDPAGDSGFKTLAWRNGWRSPDAERLLGAAAAEADLARRAQLYGELQRLLQQSSPYIILFQNLEIAARRRTVEGLSLGPSSDYTRYAGIAKQ